MSAKGLADAAVWAGLKGATLFAFVGIGQRFSFTESRVVVFTKVSSNGWFRANDGRKFQTSTKSAVYLVDGGAK